MTDTSYQWQIGDRVWFSRKLGPVENPPNAGSVTGIRVGVHDTYLRIQPDDGGSEVTKPASYVEVNFNLGRVAYRGS